MLHQVRLELTVLLALTLAVAALVLALRGGGPGTTRVAGTGGASGPVAELDFAPKGAREVAIVDFAYDPDPIRVQVGQAVAWTNHDGAMHTVTADDGSWGSKSLKTGETAVMTFQQPGVYAYICALHPPMRAGIAGAADGEKLVAGGGGHGMKGTIIVE
jgi:plastocyanin